MAIFSRGAEVIQIYPAVVSTTDDWGNVVTRPGDPKKDQPITLSGVLVQPVTEDANLEQGLSILSLYRVICEHWPSTAGALVWWDGRMFEAVENPARRRYNRRVSHDTVYIKAREESDG